MPDGSLAAKRTPVETSEQHAREPDRGRHARTPGEIPARGWRDILWRVWSELSEDNLSMYAAGVAYYGFLALFPTLVALVAIYGLVADPAAIGSQVTSMGGLLPGEARGILEEQMKALTEKPPGTLGFGAIVALLLALWSASAGMKALMQMLNTTYDETEKRGFFAFNLTALGLTLGAILFLAVALSAVVGVPVVLKFVGLGSLTEWIIAVARWPLLGALVMLALAVLYRYAPSRDEPKWQWVSWGAAVTTVLWLIGSGAFSIYVSNFGSFDKSYGSVGAVVILLLWLNITAYLVGLGAEINAEMEHQTARDTTKGPEQPLGQRRATMADTVGPSP
jgi:membrane protein